MSEPDYRSVCITVEPIFGPDGVMWRALATVGGQNVQNIVGFDRTVVIEDSLGALAMAGVDIETEVTQ